MQLIKKNIFLIFTILITVVAVMPLFHSGFFPIHDDEQVGRLYELNYALENLHVPPRISQNLGFGYGYPLFNFYPSFVYYIAEFFLILGFSYITSIKIMIGLGFILSSVFMYLFSKKYAGELGGFIAATLYVYAPYHSVDVYVRGALPEFFSFVFVPAIFWAMERLSEKQNLGSVVILGALGACLMLTHNLVFLMSIPFFFAYLLYTIYKNIQWKSYLTGIFLGGVISLLLSAYFWIPAILENKYTMVNLLTKELADYRLHFVSVRQFLNSTWGYGGSILGPSDGFSLEIGKLHIIFVEITSLSFAFLKFNKKFKNGSILILFMLLFILSVFIQSYYSKFVWDHLFVLSYIQFPWRFMLFSVFTASFIGGYLFIFKFNNRIKIITTFVIVLISLIYYGQFFKPSEYLSVTDVDYISKDILRWKTSKMAFEYVPNGISTKKSDLNTTVVNINKDEIADTTVTPLSKGVILNILVDKPQYKEFLYSSNQESKLQINTFSFPGWKVFINGKNISYNDMNKFKLITITVPEGEGLVEVIFTNTFVRSLANALTIIGTILVIVLIPFYKKKIKYGKTK